MFFFTKRLKLIQIYKAWIKKHELADCPLNVISFLSSRGLLNEDECEKFIDEVLKEENNNEK